VTGTGWGGWGGGGGGVGVVGRVWAEVCGRRLKGVGVDIALDRRRLRTGKGGIEGLTSRSS
jgi:hypothetical protein